MKKLWIFSYIEKVGGRWRASSPARSVVREHVRECGIVVGLLPSPARMCVNGHR